MSGIIQRSYFINIAALNYIGCTWAWIMTSRTVHTLAKIKNQSKVFFEMYCY